MAQLASIVQHLDTLLHPELFQDSCLNGLQIDAGGHEVRKIACAVDAGLGIMERAVAEEAQLLIVHHGMLWGAIERVTGALAKKIEVLFRGRCSLYASHLPLDSHSEVGNGFELGRFLELDRLQPFFEHKGGTVGAWGSCKPRSIDFFTEKIASLSAIRPPLTLKFGPTQIKTVGIVTGSGSSALNAAAAARLDLLVTGEPKHEAYHHARELGMNIIFGGHYATETFGVKALQQRLAKAFDVEAIFIDEDSGI